MHGHVAAPPALVAPRGLAVLHGSYPPSQQHRAGEGEHKRETRPYSVPAATSPRQPGPRRRRPSGDPGAFTAEAALARCENFARARRWAGRADALQPALRPRPRV